MKVPYLDLPRQFQDPGLRSVVTGQLDCCQFILGAEVEKFETAFASLCKTSYALGVNSGTDAIFLAMKALDIGPGDEVITVPNSFVATAGAIVAAGARPVFVDVGADYNINVDLVEAAITERTKAILPVHLTGSPADMPKIVHIAQRHNLNVVEDAAQSVAASIRGGPVGSFGDAGCFSLHPLKNLNVCGDGGVITTSSKQLYERLKLLRNHGLKNRDEIEFFGYNSRLDTLQAAVANHVLKNLDAVIEARQKNARIYDAALSGLADFVALPPRRADAVHVFHTYVIQVKDRDALREYLQKNGIETKIHYPIPIHLQKPCRQFGYRKSDFPVCENQAESIVSLPIHQYLSEEQICYVTGLIEKFYVEAGRTRRTRAAASVLAQQS